MFQRGVNRLLESSAAGSGAAGCAAGSGGGGFVCAGGGVWVFGDVAAIPPIHEVCAAAGIASARTNAIPASGPHRRERNSRIRVALIA